MQTRYSFTVEKLEKSRFKKCDIECRREKTIAVQIGTMNVSIIFQQMPVVKKALQKLKLVEG